MASDLSDHHRERDMASSGRGKRTAAKKTTGTTKRPSAGKPAASAVKRKAVAAPIRSVAKKSAAKKPASKKPATKPAGGAWAHVFTPREPGERRYWLVKSEPSTFSFDHLRAAKDQTSQWDGVRNFVARN